MLRIKNLLLVFGANYLISLIVFGLWLGLLEEVHFEAFPIWRIAYFLFFVNLLLLPVERW